MNKLLITLFSFLAIAVVSCSDDDEPKMPTNASRIEYDDWR